MDAEYVSRLPNKTAEYFYKISYISYLLGLPNFWVEDFRISDVFIKTYAVFNKICFVSFCALISLELGAFVTQDELTEKQETDRWIYCISHLILLMYCVLMSRQKANIGVLLRRLLELKEIYNDPKVEERMVHKSTLYSSALVINCLVAMVMFSVSAGYQVIKYDGTYTTLVTAWPPVDERSIGASIVRVLSNIAWWLLLNRSYGSFIFVISLITAMSHQFINLQSYFYNLDTIFMENNLSQSEKETKYEKRLKIGIKMHSDTFMCVERTKTICSGVYNGQFVFAFTTLVFLMSQMMKSERTLVNAFEAALGGSSILISTGFFFCNAGDITLEASDVATAMYCSGWQNCSSISSRRVRSLLSIAMTRAQKPLFVKGLGIVDLSYESYINLVKSSYSVFSVIY